MAATNLPDILDPALTRPGRFDRHVSLSIYKVMPNFTQISANTLKLSSNSSICQITEKSHVTGLNTNSSVSGEKEHLIPRKSDFLFQKKTTDGETYSQIVVTNPDVRGRQDILELYLQDKPMAEDVDVKAIARGTPGFNGAGMLDLFFYLAFIFVSLLMIP